VDAVTLMAVSKTRSAEEVAAALAAGITDVGENYLQEALDKKVQLDARNLTPCWHFIGPIQSNKTRDIANQFDWVHSIDREKIARRLNEQRPAELPALNICLQVNIDRETTKAGVLPEEAAGVVAALVQFPRLRLRGLMAIPQASDDPEQQRARFAAVQQLQNQLREQFPQLQLDTLSMGMSSDMEAAIAEGATIVRIGTDIFGPRAPATPH
jgi:PLP dependent protein